MYTRGRIRLVVPAGLLPGILLTSALPAQTNCSDQTDIPQLECEALVSFFAGANGDGWTNNTGWNQDNSPCDWFGVTCVEEHVTSLSLVGNELSGGHFDRDRAPDRVDEFRPQEQPARVWHPGANRRTDRAQGDRTGK